MAGRKSAYFTQKSLLACVLSILLALALFASASAMTEANRITAGPLEEYAVDKDGEPKYRVAPTLENQKRLTDPEPDAVRHEEPVVVNTPEEAADYLLIPLQMPGHLPAGYRTDTVEISVFFYDRHPDHYRLMYPAEDPDQMPMYVLVQYVGPEATFDLQALDPLEVVSINGVEGVLLDRTAKEHPVYNFFLMDGDYFIRLTYPGTDREEAIRIMESFTTF